MTGKFLSATFLMFLLGLIPACTGPGDATVGPAPDASGGRLAQPASEEPQAAGFVMEVTGEWKLDGKTVAPGDLLAFGAKLDPADPATESRITVCEFATGNARSEDGGFQMAGSAAGGGNPFWRAIGFRYQNRLVETVSRDPGNFLVSAVLPVRDGRLDLGAAMGSAKPGVYRAKIRLLSPLKTESGGDPPPIDLGNVEWKGETCLSQEPGDFRPGLYQLTAHHAETGNPIAVATVVVAGEAGFEDCRKKFAEAQAQAASWSEEIRDVAGENWIQASLEAIALELQPPGVADGAGE